MNESIRVRVRIAGRVQGIGFRPFLARRAAELHLTGTVRNERGGVVLEIQGDAAAIERYIQFRCCDLPPIAKLESVTHERIPTVPDESDFRILPSDLSAAEWTIVPPDVAVCDECLNEVNTQTDRRFGYALNSCVKCGPRFSLIRAMPFDRDNTTMQPFVMCPKCQAEYTKPIDRRFHAQTISCPECGPQIEYFTLAKPELQLRSHDAISAAREALAAGKIVAIKGIGGFHLACDATNDEAVQQLRIRKNRMAKPFAMMAKSVEIVRKYAQVPAAEESLLTRPERPIVLLNRSDTSLSSVIAPNMNTLGFMLPYTPLHHLLLDHKPLVMTSGNHGGEPIITTNTTAEKKLRGIADAILQHNRDIVIPCDDSVVRIVDEDAYFIRRSRGYAPLPIPLPEDGPTILAVGGEWKSALALAIGNKCYVGPHIGDIGSVASVAALERGAEHLLKLFPAKLDAVTCDCHPHFLSARWAADFAARYQVPLIRVQHHRAHVAALMADANHTGPLIGVCWDGTGHGDDGTIWGSEFFLVNQWKFTRMAHLAATPLPGGDAAIRNPMRAALAYLWMAGIPWENAILPLSAESGVVRRMLETGLNCVLCGSIGRLFDAASALLGVCRESTYEGQPAIELEAICRGDGEFGYTLPHHSETPLVLDPNPMIRAIVNDWQANIPASEIASRFHRGLCESLIETCRRIRDRTGVNAVGLTGGVFQNMRLLETSKHGLESAGFTVLVHRQVPPSDGGLSLGQAVYARRVGLH